MTDRRRRRAANADPSHEDNPFAPPPEGRPDRPWRPRRPAGSGEGTREGDDGEDGGSPPPGDRPPHSGSQWSRRQPGRQGGGFGGPADQDGGNGRNGGKGGRGLRWDPTDPSQRHARYALHAGIWSLFFSLFSLVEIALLLGALSVYWGISALRSGDRPSGAPAPPERGAGARPEDVAGTDRSGRGDAPRPATAPIPVAVSPAQAAKARTTAAVSGLVTGGLALVIVAASFTLQMVYSDYYTCREDALTSASREECDKLLPENIRRFMENQT